MYQLTGAQKAAVVAGAVVAAAGIAYYVSRSGARGSGSAGGSAAGSGKKGAKGQSAKKKGDGAAPPAPSTAAAVAVPAVTARRVAPEERSLEAANNVKNEGNKLFGKGKHDEAAALYTEAILLCPEGEAECAKFYANRAACYARVSRHEDVIADCTAAVNIDAKYAKAWQRRAQAYEDVGRLDEALDDLGVYSSLVGPEDPAAQAAITRVLERIGANKAKVAVTTKRGRFPPVSVVKAYLTSLRCFPHEGETAAASEGDAAAHYQAGLDHLTAGKYVEALAAFESCCRAEASHPDALLHLGTLLHLVGDHDRALEVLGRAASVPSARTGALVRTANLLFLQGKIPEAIAMFEEVLKEDPRSVVARFHAAQAYQHQAQMDVAVSHYDSILGDVPGDYEALSQKGLACFQVGLVFAQQPMGMEAAAALFHQAVESLKEATKTQPGRPEAHVHYASVLQTIGQMDEALAEYDAAIAADPTSAAAYTAKGQLVFQVTGNAAAALELHAKALEVDPDSIETRCNLAMQNLQTGNFEGAIEEYDKAIELGFVEQDLATIFAFREAAVSRLKSAQRAAAAAAAVADSEQ